ncbi:hypothetical protein [Nonomuraea gerenzanensis]|uniref:Uncharacterized protein n=1 Tax=Nonomuraea gerenzanensis TaxID=93944 RepID=A0A1M4E564_9ACTN|nr:hypothetical protein [Nonomuraea gerenzanensis]UBU16124.1 hypothetical protein LCN96_14255 [Nonomuraea gerenzanensis]SBO93930.1 hypothetical protein BN4615_P3446 [Nonomuraea gerenzanensis]
MAVKPQVSIIALVDVIGALSDRSLLNGNLVLIDDGSFASRAQGTPELCTIVQPGQVVQWTALAVDLQTPVEIRNIEFLRLQPPGQPAYPAPQAGWAAPVAGAHPGMPAPSPAQPAYAAATGHGPGAFPPGPAAVTGAPTVESEKLDLEIWAGMVPYYMVPGVAYRYRLEFQMYEGPYSVLHVETPSLMRI